MDVSRLLPRGGIINVDDHQRAERERRALDAVSVWASGCLGLNENRAAAFKQRHLSAYDGGASAERVVSDIATKIEAAGKPTLAGFASLVFRQAMDQVVPSMGTTSGRTTGRATIR